MTNRLETMAHDPECVLNGSMDREESLRLCLRLKWRMALSLSGVRVGPLGLLFS